ncbi:MAG TPA: PIN domain-containing protein, partial [Thermoanaerobaculia bacterium]|nr:PIN domain-containing protein [Thermoanaerobaculia bacterium]
KVGPDERRSALGSLRAQPWSALHLEPDRALAADLAARHPLRGADLWHLTTASTLVRELPDVSLVTFDTSLAEAARNEGV